MRQRDFTTAIRILLSVFTLLTASRIVVAGERPNIVLLMADDQGWGQTGYYDHPVLKTPNLDAMAEAGLRFGRFYAGAPNCSPTRATVMTGRTNDRTGVLNHGYPLRLQEQTVARAFQKAGYATAHFGKWHLNGLRGPGAPVLADDPLNPGAFGFDTWLSVTNFFDLNPLMSREGEIEEFEGDSSDIIVAEAIRFIRAQHEAGKPFFTVIWYGSPHSPWRARETDKQPYRELSDREQNHYGELKAMDRSIGAVRAALREMKLEQNTLVWYCSDNGGLQPFGPATVGGLRGWKNTMYEGGLRVPAIIEWPAGIEKPRVTSYPAATMDIFPTLADVAGLPKSVLLEPQDGLSLKPVFTSEPKQRDKPIPFRHQNRAALIDNDFKLLTLSLSKPKYELYNLADDPTESTDVSDKYPEKAAELKKEIEAFNASVEASRRGEDYPEGRITAERREPRVWMTAPEYEPFLKEWSKRPEYAARIRRERNGK
jgi:arylsulfatase A-like enzyme